MLQAVQEKGLQFKQSFTIPNAQYLVGETFTAFCVASFFIVIASAIIRNTPLLAFTAGYGLTNHIAMGTALDPSLPHKLTTKADKIQEVAILALGVLNMALYTACACQILMAFPMGAIITGIGCFAALSGALLLRFNKRV